MGKSTVKVEFNHYDQIADKLHKATVEIVKNAAFNVEHRAKDHAPHVTGALQNSIYTVTQESSGYGAAAAGVASANPKAEMQSEEPRPDKDTTAVVHAGAEYALYVEYGTRSMGAKPYLTPAVEAERPDWERALRTLEERLKK